MDNPWNEIKLSDYENHMKQDSVMQLQTLNGIMKKQLDTYPGGTAMILGCAGGNGLEHIDTEKYKTVYCVDINPDYLRETQRRYSGLGDVLECLCIDLTKELSDLPCADLVIADLLIEYIGYDCFRRVIGKVCPKYASCVIQINTDDGFVSDSPYIHCFDGLDCIHHRIECKKLVGAMDNIGYDLAGTAEYPLPNLKKLVQLDFIS